MDNNEKQEYDLGLKEVSTITREQLIRNLERDLQYSMETMAFYHGQKIILQTVLSELKRVKD